MSDIKLIMIILVYNIILNKDVFIQYGTFQFKVVSPKKNYQLIELVIILITFNYKK